MNADRHPLLTTHEKPFGYNFFTSMSCFGIQCLKKVNVVLGFNVGNNLWLVSQTLGLEGLLLREIEAGGDFETASK